MIPVIFAFGDTDSEKLQNIRLQHLLIPFLPIDSINWFWIGYRVKNYMVWQNYIKILRTQHTRNLLYRWRFLRKTVGFSNEWRNEGEREVSKGEREGKGKKGSKDETKTRERKSNRRRSISSGCSFLCHVSSFFYCQILYYINYGSVGFHSEFAINKHRKK